MSNPRPLYVVDRKKRYLVGVILVGTVASLLTIGITPTQFLSLPIGGKIIWVGLWFFEIFLVVAFLTSRRTEFHEHYLKAEIRWGRMKQIAYSDLRIESVPRRSVIGITQTNNAGEPPFKISSSRDGWSRSYRNRIVPLFGNKSLRDWLEDRLDSS